MNPVRVARLFVHPVKGAAPVEVDAWDVDAYGLRDDRRWMIVAEDGRFLTQRSLPRMALIRVALHDGGLRFQAPGSPDLDLPPDIARPDGERMTVTVWNDTVRSRVVDGGAGDWLSRALGVRASLVWMPDEGVPVRILPRHIVPGVEKDHPVSFADAFPFLLVSSESVDALNARIEGKPEGDERPHIIVQRFRPNVVVSGAGAHAEDGWRRIAIGALEFLVAKPCARCAVPTVDPANGVRGTEPTRTLATYRRHDGQVWFGQNLVHENTGRLAVGDLVKVTEQAIAPNPPL